MCEITKSFSLEDWVVAGQCERVCGQCICACVCVCVYMCLCTLCWEGLGGAWAFCLPTDMDLRLNTTEKPLTEKECVTRYDNIDSSRSQYKKPQPIQYSEIRFVFVF